MPGASANARVPYGLLRPVITSYSSLDLFVRRSRLACENFVGGFVAHALNLEEQTDLTASIYDATPSRRTEIFAWETAWFEQMLPPAPARVLLGGAGSGREARWLQDAGYRVDAFDPAPSAARALEDVVNDAAFARCGGYEELVRAANGETNALSPFAGCRYDAVLAGWESLSHVLGAHSRRALFELCHRLCTHGPILASFAVARATTNQGRARAWGERAGRIVGTLRGLRERPEAHQARFLSHAGFVHEFTLAELESLGSALGRRMEYRPSPYPHATWLPPQPT